MPERPLFPGVHEHRGQRAEAGQGRRRGGGGAARAAAEALDAEASSGESPVLRGGGDRGAAGGFPISAESSHNSVYGASPSGGSAHRYGQQQQSQLKQQAGPSAGDGAGPGGMGFRGFGADEGAGFGIIRGILDRHPSPGSSSIANASASPAASGGDVTSDADVSSSGNSASAPQPQPPQSSQQAQQAQPPSASAAVQPGAMRLADQLRSFDALRGDLNDRLRHRLEHMRSSREESYRAKFNAFQVRVRAGRRRRGTRASTLTDERHRMRARRGATGRSGAGDRRDARGRRLQRQPLAARRGGLEARGPRAHRGLTPMVRGAQRTTSGAQRR